MSASHKNAKSSFFDASMKQFFVFLYDAGVAPELAVYFQESN